MKGGLGEARFFTLPMASRAFVALPSISPFRIKLSNNRMCQPSNGTTLLPHRRTFPKHSVQVMMAQFGESERLNAQLNAVTERLQEAIPDSVKHFPWKKAETVLLDRVVLLGQTLTVTVVEAKNLKDEDLIGKSDPYIKLILNENNTQATSTKSGDLNPTYNETFTFNIDGHKHLDIECWDKDTVTSDDIIGKNDVSLSHVISKGTAI